MRERIKASSAQLAGEQNSSFSCVVKYELMRDVNNGKYRPNSSCTHYKSEYKPIPVAVRANYGGGFANLNIPADWLVLDAKAKSLDYIIANESRLIKRLDNFVANFSSPFSSLNFLYELREISGLFKELHKYRYIDWQFGISPMIADIKNAIQHYDDLAKKSKENKWRKIHEFSSKTMSTNNTGGEENPFSGNGHIQFATTAVSSRLKGKLGVTEPYLSQVNPEIYGILDSLAIDISAGNAWEAVPWSWFIDWFLPVGEVLDAFPSLMKPLVGFDGTISHSVNHTCNFTSQYVGPGYTYVGGDNAGLGLTSLYERKAFGSLPQRQFKFRVESLSNPGNIALLRDIIFPVKRG